MPPEAIAFRTRKLAHRFGIGPHFIPPQRAPDAEPSRKVDLDFVVIGAQKAGSTFLHQAIQHHASLHMPIGEVPVFQDPDYSADALAWLERITHGAPPGTLKGIKRPDYLGRPESPGYLARHVPHAKLVAVLREPASRTLSAYYHYMRRGHLPALDPEIGIPLLLDGNLQRDWPRAWEVLAFSCYGECLDRYMEYFDRSQLCVLLQDDVIQDPTRSVRRVYRFLGVDDSFEPPGLRGRALPTVYSLPRVRFLAWAEKLRTSSDRADGRRYHRSGVLAKVAYASAMLFDRMVLKPMHGNERAVLSERTALRLEGYFREDRVKLRRHLGGSVPKWCG